MSTAGMQQSPPPLWRNISFHLLWSSTFASGFGDRMGMLVAMAMLGYGLEGADNSGIQALVNFFFFLPYLIWSPVAGWLTDRLPRKWVLLAADQSRGAILLCMLLLVPASTVVVPEAQQWMVWGIMLGLGIMAAIFVPARLSVVPSVVGMSLITRANGAVVSMGVIGNLFGLLLGGALVEHSLERAIQVGAACYIISGAFWIFLRMPWEKAWSPTPMRTPLDAFREVADGLRYIAHKRVLRTLVLMVAIVWAGTAVYVPAIAALNVQLYGEQIGTHSRVLGMVGLGMLVGAVGLGMCNPIRGLEVLMLVGLVGLAICLGLQAVIPVLGVGMVLSFGVGLSGAFLMVPLYTLIQRLTANHLRGRVFGAKEVVGEFGMVAISLVVWQVANTDPLMQPLMIILAAIYVAAAVYGYRRYVARGPMPDGLLNLLWRSLRFICEAMHQLRVRGHQHVPREGGVLLVANHTAGTDPMLIQASLPRVVRWIMAKEYMLPGLGWIWRRTRPIAVERKGRDTSALREAVRALREGDLVAVFPEGGIGREGRELRSFSSGVGWIAAKSGATIVPAWIDGTPRGRVLSAYLRFSRSRVTYGEPFTIDAGAGAADAAELIRSRVAALGDRDAAEHKQAAET